GGDDHVVVGGALGQEVGVVERAGGAGAGGRRVRSARGGATLDGVAAGAGRRRPAERNLPALSGRVDAGGRGGRGDRAGLGGIGAFAGGADGADDVEVRRARLDVG